MQTDIGRVRVYYGPIVPGKGDSAREAERRCIHSLIMEAFGQDAVLLHDTSGRPYIDGSSISVSHSRHWGALAVAPADTRVGVDIEESAYRAARVIGRVLRGPHASEYMNPDYALAGWTLLEAAFKCAYPNDGLTLVDFHLPQTSGGLSGKNVVMPDRPDTRLSILASGFLIDGVWMSIVVDRALDF